MAEETGKTDHLEKDKVDFLLLIRHVWSKKRTILFCFVIFVGIGLFVAMVSPKVFSVTTTMVPQSSSGSSKNSFGSLSSIAAIAGLNLDFSNSSELSPLIYPQIIASTPFQKELMNSEIKVSTLSEPVTIFTYFQDHYSPGILESSKGFVMSLPRKVVSIFRSPSPESAGGETESLYPYMSLQEMSVSKRLRKDLSLDIDQKEGYISITSSFHEPLAAAQIAETTQKLLQKYVTRIKVEKAKAELSFIEERLLEKESKFEEAQNALADFRDKNQNVTKALARTEEERLENEYQLAFSVYTELAKQSETAKIRVEEDTPSFSIISPVTIPTEKVKPKRFKILIIWSFLGIIAGIGLVVTQEYTSKFRELWKNLSASISTEND